MATLNEQPELRRKIAIQSSFYTGWEYYRTFRFPAGELATHLAGTLAPGTVLAATYGGVATTNVEDPKLQSVSEAQQKGGALLEVQARYVQIDTSGSRVTGYIECARGRHKQDAGDRTYWTIYGMAPTISDAGIPAVGAALDGGATLLTPVCQSAMPRPWQFGRVLVVTRWMGYKAE